VAVRILVLLMWLEAFGTGFKRATHNHKIRVAREGGPVLKLDYEHLLKHWEQNVSVQNDDHILLLSQ